MTAQDIMPLMARALAALTAASDLAREQTEQVTPVAADQELQTALKSGHAMLDTWQQRAAEALAAAGQEQDVKGSDPAVLRVIYDAGRSIRREIADEKRRDLEIIENSQLALHTWIVAFGTLATYAQQADNQDIERAMRSSKDEAEQADVALTSIAKRLLQG